MFQLLIKCFIDFWFCNLCHCANSPANVALGGVTDQSSVWDPTLLSNLVIDGNPNSNYNYRSCFSTLFEVNPWWRLDLQVQYNISSIEVIRRSDCCALELNGAEIRIGNSLENNGNNNPRCLNCNCTSCLFMLIC